MLACLVVCGDMGGAVDCRYVVRRWVGIAVKSSGIMDEDRKKTETNTERVESSCLRGVREHAFAFANQPPNRSVVLLLGRRRWGLDVGRKPL